MAEYQLQQKGADMNKLALGLLIMLVGMMALGSCEKKNNGPQDFSDSLLPNEVISEVIRMQITKELAKTRADMGIMGVELTCTDYNGRGPWTYKGTATFVSSYEWDRELTAIYNGKNKKVTYSFDDQPKETTTFKWDSVFDETDIYGLE
jgi:hypothetical protein